MSKKQSPSNNMDTTTVVSRVPDYETISNRDIALAVPHVDSASPPVSGVIEDGTTVDQSIAASIYEDPAATTA